MLEDDQHLSQPEFWDKRYAAAVDETPTHEWLRTFPQLESFLSRHLLDREGTRPGDKPRILHLGSGDSVVPAELSRRGYRAQLCVDFSPVVVDMMSPRHKGMDIAWQRMDVRHMTLADGSIHVAFDKGTMDAMIYGSPWTPPEEVKVNTGAYMREVQRVLKDDGLFLCISYRQPHFMRPLLNHDGIWDVQVEQLGSSGSIGYHGYVLTRTPPSPSVTATTDRP